MEQDVLIVNWDRLSTEEKLGLVIEKCMGYALVPIHASRISLKWFNEHPRHATWIERNNGYRIEESNKVVFGVFNPLVRWSDCMTMADQIGYPKIEKYGPGEWDASFTLLNGMTGYASGQDPLDTLCRAILSARGLQVEVA